MFFSGAQGGEDMFFSYCVENILAGNESSYSIPYSVVVPTLDDMDLFSAELYYNGSRPIPFAVHNIHKYKRYHNLDAFRELTSGCPEVLAMTSTKSTSNANEGNKKASIGQREKDREKGKRRRVNGAKKKKEERIIDKNRGPAAKLAK